MVGSGQLLLYMGNNFICLPAVEPLKGGVFPEPGELPFCVLAGMCFDIIDGLVEGDVSVEEAKDFLVADSA